MPGVVLAIPADGQGKYLAVYEVETDDLQNAFAASEQIMARKTAEGRMSELLQILSVTSFRQLYSLSERILVPNH